MKICRECKNELDLDKFGKNKNFKDGLMPVCKSCNVKRVKAWQVANPEKVKYDPERSIRRHGITIQYFNELKEKFNGLCHSCQYSMATVVDHDHNCCPGPYGCSKCVRGLLCSNCNTALGLLKDSGKRIIDLLDYTLRSQA